MSKQNYSFITPKTLKSWIHDGNEIALIDVREHGQYGEEHLFSVVSIPYSRLEYEVQKLVPRLSVRLVLVDDEQGQLAIKASQRLHTLGFQNIHILQGGVTSWREAGYEVFAGVNLPSKAFGELAEHAFNTPKISAVELNEKIKNKENIIVLDGRPFSEYKKMSIPTAICCPNGELPLRIDDLVTSPDTTIVINCAGRTRSIIGAQTLINLGIPNKVLALENGTQGWYLADLQLNHGESKRHGLEINQSTLTERHQRAYKLAKSHGVKFINWDDVEQLLADEKRTTYLCDVRTPEEFSTGTVPGAQHTPGGQLVQATDQYIGTKGARLVLIDQEGVRAPAMASWLAMLGWEVMVCENAIHQHQSTQNARSVLTHQGEKQLQTDDEETEQIGAQQIAPLFSAGAIMIDLRPSMKYRQAHIKNAKWSIRPHLATIVKASNAGKIILLVEEPFIAKLAAKDLKELGVKQIFFNIETEKAWEQAGLILETTPDIPSHHECIDYLFFVHDRHDGNKASARQYLAWEVNLLNQIDDLEKNTFKLPHE